MLPQGAHAIVCSCAEGSSGVFRWRICNGGQGGNCTDEDIRKLPSARKLLLKNERQAGLPNDKMIRSAAKDKSKESKEAKSQETVSSCEVSTLVEETVRSPSKSICAAELSGSEEEASEVESFILDENDEEHEPALVAERFLLSAAGAEGQSLQTVPVDPETHARLEALLEAAGISKLSSKDGKALTDPEVLRTLTSSVSSALDEAAQALHRMRSEQTTQLICDNPALSESGFDAGSSQGRKIYDCNNAEGGEEGESLLSLACSAGYYELAQVLLAMKANVEDRGVKGDCTPLMEAASGGHLDIVKLLINHNADINAQSTAGNTPLHYAACGGYCDVVKELLQVGASVEVHNENGHTPLMEAASAGHVDVARLLLEAGAGINTHSNEFKESALTLACYKGHLPMVTFLLGAGADQEHKTDEMHTALMEASMDGHVDVARLLLDSGAQVNMPADSFESPLTLAACGGHVELANLLIERGANIEEVNDEGYTPLMEAAREGHEEMVALLLSHDAQINAQTEETQETALTLACCGGFQDVAEYLISRGANIELGCSTPLMEAAQEGHLELVKHLLDAGANVHAQTATGDTALTYACENGHTDVAGLLLERGAKLEHESEGGRTPLMKAARAGHLCTVQFLINKGASVNRTTTTNDHTVLSLACAGGHQPVVELLLSHGADYKHKLKDGSTMIIEAAKGGHTSVVNLLLEWPTRSHELVPEERVPTQGLPHVVPPNEPDPLGVIPSTSIRQGKCHEQARPGVQKPLVKRCANGATSSKAGGGSTGVSADAIQQLNLDGSFLTDMHQDKDATEKVEAIINSIMAKEMMCSTAASQQEQIQRKQQILEELQKVERELKGKAQTQYKMAAGLEQQSLTKAKSSAKPPSDESPGPSPQGRKKPEGAISTALDSLGVNSELTYNLASSSLLQSGDCFSAQPHALHSSFPEAFLQQPFLPPQNNGFISPDPAKQVPAKGSVPAKRNGNSKAIRAGKGKEQQQQPPPAQAQPLVLNFPADLTGSPTDQQPLACEGGAAAAANCEQEGVPSLPLQNSSLQIPGPILKQALNPVPPFQLQPQGQSSVFTPQQQQQLYLQQKHAQILQQTQQTQQQQQQQQAQILQQQQLASTPGSPTMFTPNPKVASSRKQQRMQFPPNTLPAPPSPQGSPVLGEASTPPPSIPSTPNPAAASPQGLPYCPSTDLDAQTESNHDTALTLACAGGHAELVQLLLNKGADIEHRDKKGFTPLILAATAGHPDVVEILLDHQADIEAQSERTKDTPLSLACSGGRYEVVELLLQRGANKEHRNVSDYTPLSLAASGGYVNIIKLLLNHGAEINSRTGSKLGISPLMLASMNGHTQAVKVLLDMGSDINAQIETNKNTALTLACFQGRHEVVSLLVDRKANIEHRAKTGLTPLMEAASGGYVEVGRVLLDKGADVNALPVPSSRDTALTIAADKGHYRFVELLVQKKALVDVKNKKGNSPLWLACNGGHLDVVQFLVNNDADKDSQDNRKVSCLMAAFRKGHVKVVKWMVKKVTQFPSDQELKRFVSQLNDKDLQKKCQTCMDIITHAKEHQAAEANKNATILLQELDKEKEAEAMRKAAQAAKRERRRKKKKEKLEKGKGKENEQVDANEGKELDPCAGKNSSPEPESADSQELEKEEEEEVHVPPEPPAATPAPAPGSSMKPLSSMKPGRKLKQEGDGSGGTALELRKNKKNRKDKSQAEQAERGGWEPEENLAYLVAGMNHDQLIHEQMISNAPTRKSRIELPATNPAITDLDEFTPRMERSGQTATGKRSNLDRNGPCDRTSDSTGSAFSLKSGAAALASPKRGPKKDDGWKEVVSRNQAKNDKQQKKTQGKGDRTRKKSGSEYDVKKVQVGPGVISRVIGRGGHNINTIRVVSGAHCDIDKATPNTTMRSITVKGAAESTQLAHKLIICLTETDKDISEILAQHNLRMPERVPIANNVADHSDRQTGSHGRDAATQRSSRTAGSSSSTGSHAGPPSGRMPSAAPPSAWQNPPAAAATQSPRRSPQKQVVTQPTPRLPTPGAPGGGERSVRQQLFSSQVDGSTAPSLAPPSPATVSSLPSSAVPTTTSAATLATSSSSVKLSSSTASTAVTKEGSPVVTSKAETPMDEQAKSFEVNYPNRVAAMAKSEAPSFPAPSSSAAALPSPSSSTAAGPAAHGGFSPFTHRLNIASNIGLNKNDQDRMNYSSVAASGASNTLVSSLAHSTSPTPEESRENLLLKAPGYNKINRAASPQHRVADPSQGAPRGFIYTAPPPIPHGPSVAELEAVRPRSQYHNLPYPGNPFSRSTANGLSPRGPAGPVPPPDVAQSAHLGGLSHPSPRDEYCSKQRPLTLPKINSSLNPDAPDFQERPKHPASMMNGNFRDFGPRSQMTGTALQEQFSFIMTQICSQQQPAEFNSKAMQQQRPSSAPTMAPTAGDGPAGPIGPPKTEEPISMHSLSDSARHLAPIGGERAQRKAIMSNGPPHQPPHQPPQWPLPLSAEYNPDWTHNAAAMMSMTTSHAPLLMSSSGSGGTMTYSFSNSHQDRPMAPPDPSMVQGFSGDLSVNTSSMDHPAYDTYMPLMPMEGMYRHPAPSMYNPQGLGDGGRWDDSPKPGDKEPPNWRGWSPQTE